MACQRCSLYARDAACMLAGCGSSAGGRRKESLLGNIIAFPLQSEALRPAQFDVELGKWSPALTVFMLTVVSILWTTKL